MRDRYFDSLRVLAIIRVSVYHMFPFAVLELVFPSMGVMFALAGSLMANSLARGSSRYNVIFGRIRRLLPAYWVLGLFVVPAMLLLGWDERPALWHLTAWVVPFVSPPSSDVGLQAQEVIWYLVTYLWLVALSPVLLWLYRRAWLVTIVAPLALLLALTIWPAWPANPNFQDVGTDLLTYAGCWILGFAHRDGTLRKVSAGLVASLAVVCVGGALFWAHRHGALQDMPVAYGIYQIGFVLALLRWQPDMAWLTRRRGLDNWVTLINARAVTIYLWNNVAIALCFPIGDALSTWILGQTGEELSYCVIALALLTNAVLLFGWVEDLAAKRTLRFLPWPHPTPAKPAGRATVPSLSRRWNDPVPHYATTSPRPRL
ncbi:acyltransferase [Actinoplanes sp. NPDC049598]|uniref:acyltransferase family protein n=1 Tax=Actinoplanes sp. NPDC049598 TaxID=3154626 RepID=UPI003424902E